MNPMPQEQFDEHEDAHREEREHMHQACRACGSAARERVLEAEELVLRHGDRFAYFECAGCGCVQIERVPEDLARYYPSDYYSFERPRLKRYPELVRALRAWRTRALLGRHGRIGATIARALGLGRVNEHFTWLAPAGVDLDSRILDVGCGNGRLLAKLAREGFTSLAGADPFLAPDAAYPGVTLQRATIDAIAGEYDLVMLHHSLEHMPDPLGALGHAKRLMAPGGRLLVRIPLADSHAFRKYGPYWTGFDAPRHLCLFTVVAFTRLAERAGLALVASGYDSTAKQFHSELAIRGIPMRDLDRHRAGAPAALWTSGEWRALEREARRLNRLRDGDTGWFMLGPVIAGGGR